MRLASDSARYTICMLANLEYLVRLLCPKMYLAQCMPHARMHHSPPEGNLAIQSSTQLSNDESCANERYENRVGKA